MRRALLLLICAACVDLPEEEKVEDLRIIEIRNSPPEIPIFREVRIDAEASDLASLEPNFDPVSFSAVIAHPDLDARFGVDWIRCTGEGGNGFERVPCGGNEKVKLGSGSPFEISPIQLLFDDVAGFSGSPEAALTALADDPRDLFSGLRLIFNAQATVESASIDVDTQTIEGIKRLIVFDPTIVSLVLREARRRGAGGVPTIPGVQLPTLCTNVSDEEFGVVLDYLATRGPNQAPTFVRLELRRATETGTVTWAPGDPPLEVMPGELIRIRGRAAEGDLEKYQVIDDKCRLIDFTETMAWSWFTNVGDLSDQVTSQSTVSVEGDAITTWTAPAAEDLEEERTRARIWSVLRDGRGGSDSAFIDLVISKSG